MKKLITLLFTAVFAIAMSAPQIANAQIGCPAPNGLSSSNIGLFSAELDWNTSILVSTSILEIRPVGFQTWIPIPVQQPPFTVPALLCGTDYEWRVQAICALGPILIPSPFSSIQTFTTLSCNNLCPVPTNLSASNITENTVDLSWDIAPQFLNDFNLRYRVAGSLAWTNVDNINEPYSLSGLQCGTDYEWEVQTICPNPFGNPLLGPWSPASTFSTSACPVICDVPTNLNSGNIAAYGADLMWTNANAPGATYQLRYRMLGSAAWTLISNVSSPYSVSGLTCNTAFEWQVRTQCLDAGIIIYSSWSLLNNFTTGACPTACPVPTNLTASNLGLQSADLGWVATATPPTTYQLRYRALGTTAWILVNTPASPYQLTGLGCKTTYEWQVRTNCTSIPLNSAWSGIHVFATLDCNAFCPGPIGITTSNVTLNSAQFSWNVVAPGTVAFQLRHRELGTINWNFVNNATSPFAVSNLTCGTDYEWQIRTVCGDGGNVPYFYSPWSSLQNFATLDCAASCPDPTALSTTNIALYSASLNWSLNTPAAVGFDIRYRLAGTVAWTQVNNVTSPHQISALTCSTPYEWEVRTVCGNAVSNDPYSPWSATQSFSTLTCTFSCPSPNGLSATNITDQSADLSWVATAPGLPGYQLRYRVIGSGSWTFFSSAANPFAATGLTCNSDYQWQVRTICGTPGVGAYSAWSSLGNFTTASCRTYPAVNHTSEGAKVTVYPNPANQMLNLSYVSEGSSAATVEIRDIFGKLVHQFDAFVNDGLMETAIETGNLVNGMYLLTVKDAGQSTTTRFVIQR